MIFPSCPLILWCLLSSLLSLHFGFSLGARWLSQSLPHALPRACCSAARETAAELHFLQLLLWKQELFLEDQIKTQQMDAGEGRVKSDLPK